MRLLARVISLAAMPVFFMMALLTWRGPSWGPAGLDWPSASPVLALCSVVSEQIFGLAIPDGMAQFLSSMGLMYLLMGIVCMPPWLAPPAARRSGSTNPDLP